MGMRTTLLYLGGILLFVAQFGRIFTSKHHMNNQSVLFVTAHPDDESMFFGPTLLNVLNANRRNVVHLLVMSTGDAEGLGGVRTQEMTFAAEKLGIRDGNLVVIDDAKLPDSMEAEWDTDLIAQYVAKELEDRKIQTVITFDDEGVSGHTNHKAVFAGTLKASVEYATEHEDFSMMTLYSVPLWRKFLFSADSVLSRIITIPGVTYHIISGQSDYHWIRTGLREHKSQMVWYRHLWSFFSRYMIVNDLSEINFGRALRSKVFEDSEKLAKLEQVFDKPIGTEGVNLQTSAVRPKPTKDRAVTRRKPDSIPTVSAGGAESAESTSAPKMVIETVVAHSEL